MDDIRLVYIGSPQRAFEYAGGHLAAPRPRLDQVYVLSSAAGEAFHRLLNFELPSDCHIATELHNTTLGTHAAAPDAAVIFEAALARRVKRPKAEA